MIPDVAIELDHRMAGNIFSPFYPAVAREIAAAAIKRPGNIGNSTPHETFFVRDTGAYRNIGFTLGDVEAVVAHDEFDPQAGMTVVKGLKQWRLHQAVADRLRTCYPNRAGRRVVCCNEMALERGDGFFDLFGPGLQFDAELGEAITRRMPDNDIPPDPFFQFD